MNQCFVNVGENNRITLILATPSPNARPFLHSSIIKSKTKYLADPSMCTPFPLYPCDRAGVWSLRHPVLSYRRHCTALYTPDQGSQPPGPQTGASHRPVADRAAQQEMRGDRDPHRANRPWSPFASCCAAMPVCPLPAPAPIWLTMSTNQQDWGQEELQIGMESSSRPLPY